jgi:beta-phosphoglucomutase-like phosphatase (HAD superfamily)
MINFNVNEETVFFFDMDGTLVNTDFANFLSYQSAINTVFGTVNDIEFYPNERFNRTVLKRDFPNLNEKKYNDIVRLKEHYYSENLSQTKLINETYKILEKYSKSNTTVLVTNCREERAVITLNYHNLIDKFTHIFFRTSIDKDSYINKFENALINLKISPKFVLVFENETAEIEDAIKAGIPITNIISI